MHGTNAAPVKFAEGAEPANEQSSTECDNCGTDTPLGHVWKLQGEIFCSSCAAQVALDVLDPGERASLPVSPRDVEEAWHVYVAAGLQLKLARMRSLTGGG